ncbi:hypothetical protein C8E03_10271 [Lachnotalea glycerini]|uniref:Uncharacterized protein n=1 Tax=Lachnotalea glycerini TaxID=1763509 RepID=A0A255IIY6_9FIRM|nr:hypothetical protein [Lachnotalea glycerini]PXV93304.1 hypothetical protein C8E03_10271 [Lachnotalea glycerini]RDY31879.1 hypothetical protein CG710_006960 [Lachnotalea glycerini]
MSEVINCKPRKLKTKYKRSQVRKRLQRKKIDIIVRQYENDGQAKTVIVKKISFLAKTMEIAANTFFQLGRFFIWAGICLLITIGLNTLLNNQLREQMIQMFCKLMER